MCVVIRQLKTVWEGTYFKSFNMYVDLLYAKLSAYEDMLIHYCISIRIYLKVLHLM